MIVVTQLDGRKMALNVDRIERVERNEAGDDTNIYLVGGARLTVTNPADEVVADIIEAKSRVLARAFDLSSTPYSPSLGQMSSPTSLHVLPTGADRS
jgi:uncharacterized protein YlzI (FlbEa/FlbD family)